MSTSCTAWTGGRWPWSQLCLRGYAMPLFWDQVTVEWLFAATYRWLFLQVYIQSLKPSYSKKKKKSGPEIDFILDIRYGFVECAVGCAVGGECGRCCWMCFVGGDLWEGLWEGLLEEVHLVGCWVFKRGNEIRVGIQQDKGLFSRAFFWKLKSRVSHCEWDGQKAWRGHQNLSHIFWKWTRVSDMVNTLGAGMEGAEIHVPQILIPVLNAVRANE